MFEESGDLTPTSRTWASDQAFANINNAYLSQYGMKAVVTGVLVNTSEDTVLVQVSAQF